MTIAFTTISVEEAQSRFTDLARRVAAGETIVVTLDGKPVLNLVPHRSEVTSEQRKGGLNLEAGREFKRKHGIDRIVEYIADDFDDPLAEDFLLRPLP